MTWSTPIPTFNRNAGQCRQPGPLDELILQT